MTRVVHSMVGTLEPVLWHKQYGGEDTFHLVFGDKNRFFLKDYWKICLSFSSNSIPSQYWKEVLTFFNWENPPWRVKRASPCFQGRWRSRSSVFFPSRSWKLVFRFTSCDQSVRTQHLMLQVCRSWWDIGSSPNLWKNLMYVFLSFQKQNFFSQNILL